MFYGVYIYHIFFIHSSVNEHLSFFHVLASVNSIAINVGVLVSFPTMVFLWCMSRSGIAESYSSSIFSFLRNFHTIIHSVSPIYIPFSPNTLYNLFIYLFIYFCRFYDEGYSGFFYSSVGKESVCKSGDPSLISGSWRPIGDSIGYPLQYSWASLVAQLVKNPPAMWETWVWSLGWEDPLEKGKPTHSSILGWRITCTL